MSLAIAVKEARKSEYKTPSEQCIGQQCQFQLFPSETSFEIKITYLIACELGHRVHYQQMHVQQKAPWL